MKENWEVTVFASIFLAIQLILLINTAGKNLGWDPSVYVGMSKYIYSLGEIGYWEVLRPELLPIILGPFWLLGLPMRITAPIVTITIATITLLAVYYMVKKHINKEVAIYTVGLTTSSYIFFTNNARVGTETLAALFIITAVYLAANQRYTTAGIITSLAFLTRYPSAIVGPAILTYIIAKGIRKEDRRLTIQKISRYVAGTLTLLIPFFLTNYYLYGNPLESLITGYETPLGNPDQYLYGMYYMLEVAQDNILYILAPIGVFLTIYKKETRYIPFATALIFLYGAHEYYSHKEARYATLFIPLLALFAAYTIREARIKQNWLTQEQAYYAIISLLIVTTLGAGIQTYGSNAWIDEDAEDYYTQFEGMEGTIAGNEPALAVYSEAKLVMFQLEHDPIDQYEQKISEISYIGIDTCSWYDLEGLDRKEKEEEFLNLLKNNHEAIYEQDYENWEGRECTRFVFET